MSYEQLLSIIAEARDIDAQERAKAPVECPNDHTTLIDAGNGILHCPWDGWQHPRDS